MQDVVAAVARGIDDHDHFDRAGWRSACAQRFQAADEIVLLKAWDHDDHAQIAWWRRENARFAKSKAIEVMEDILMHRARILAMLAMVNTPNDVKAIYGALA